LYETILVPLDGSARAEAIIPHVEELAHKHESRVIFLQVVEHDPAMMTSSSGSAQAVEVSVEGMKRRAKDAETYLSSKQGEFREIGIEARTRVEHGSVVDAIINAAEREKADLIAMASHGRTGLARAFYGGVAAGVLHRVDRPLLLIRSRRSG
jgi:nucleotide-binding universal stress UspA family protein